ncbi:hypothetical protein [Planococcus faecalis]|uniref:DUF4355 domain-containing protein n=1 Tax=Planococcus faecalis TaxID=1598147 RepID=A0ABM6IS04_9BACL|nr:hypothetical protein [Planococcus faecalis]AQU78311.1 hypothetical protein AJGP001_02915 [Planococcus faecalis]OHX51303.1 hypothetical protein BB777_17325 [Planococcus faecalis]
MTYTTIFKEDAEYQSFTNEYLRKKARFEEMAQQGLYNKEHLKEVANKLHKDLETNVKTHHQTRIETIEKRMDELQKVTQKTRYAERPGDAKEFEMRFKLANDYELQNMVQDLDTTDLLEITLLRMELKNRNLEQQSERVKRYAILNKLDGMTEQQQQEQEELQYQLGVFSTLGTRNIILNDAPVPLDNIGRELSKTANQVVNDKVIRDVDLNQF